MPSIFCLFQRKSVQFTQFFQLVVSYLLARDNAPLNTLAARLLLDCLPGLDSSVVFTETEDLVAQLFRWAESGAEEPLRSYATGLLASAMEVSDIASNYRAQNAAFVPIALRRLREIKVGENFCFDSDSWIFAMLYRLFSIEMLWR